MRLKDAPIGGPDNSVPDNSVLGQFGPGQFGPEMTITQKIKIGKI